MSVELVRHLSSIKHAKHSSSKFFCLKFDSIPFFFPSTKMASTEAMAAIGSYDCTFLDDIDEETIVETLKTRFKLGKVLNGVAGSVATNLTRVVHCLL